jgi:hypothetical protein
MKNTPPNPQCEQPLYEALQLLAVSENCVVYTYEYIYSNSALFDSISITVVIFVVSNGMNIHHNNSVVEFVNNAGTWWG